MDSHQELDRSPLPFLHLVETLKHLPRTGWLRTIEHPESVASHSFRLALLGGCAPAPLDYKRCMIIGLCHDLAEAVVGDIPSFANVPKEEKHKRESWAFRYITALISPCSREFADEIERSWDEYEHGTTPEGRWMKQMDKLECLIQAHEYEQKTFGEKDLNEFQGLKSKIILPEAKEWVELLEKERTAHLCHRQKRLSVIFITGNPSHGLCAQLCEELGLGSLCVQNLLREASEDQAFPHQAFIQNGLAHNYEIPPGLVVSLLQSRLSMRSEDVWTIVHGLTADCIIEFEKRVQRLNYIIHLGGSVGSSHTPDRAGSKPAGWSMEIDSSSEEAYSSVKEAVSQLINSRPLLMMSAKDGQV